MTMLNAKHAEGHPTFGINGLTGKVRLLDLFTLMFRPFCFGRAATKYDIFYRMNKWNVG
jgi:hypothetical protein